MRHGKSVNTLITRHHQTYKIYYRRKKYWLIQLIKKSGVAIAIESHNMRELLTTQYQ